MFKNALILFGLLLSLFPVKGFAGLAEDRAELENIRHRVAETSTELKASRAAETSISRELGVINATLERIARRTEELVTERQQLQEEIGQQQQRIEASRLRTRKVRSRLEKRLVALYKEGESGPLKILFSAQSPTEMMQQYHYLTRVLAHDRTLLADYRQALQSQQRQLQRLKSLEQDRTALLEQERAEQETAQESRTLKQQLLQRAARQRKRLAQELSELKEKAARLEELISRVEQSTAGGDGTATQFSAGRGTLGWPVDGRILIGFGTQKDAQLGTYYESHGIEIAAPPGTPVRAVAAGRIVFADYFKGYGNLFIIQHPGGYHTLYAQTDRMQKELGDQVEAGDLLGYSGLGGRRSIYFEVRAQGAPVDPLIWLSRPSS